MGIDATLFRELVEFSTRFQPKARSLMLGRQGFSLQTRFSRVYWKALHRAGLTVIPGDLVQADGFSETLFAGLGLGVIESMDISDFEGASIVHDLNVPVDPSLHGEFDFIFDGGTLEHVFNAPQAMVNVFHMLKPGGRFVSANGLNGWVGHGMWQFSPEVIWTFWKRQAGCNVIHCTALKAQASNWRLDLPDASDHGVRLRMKNKIPEGRIYLTCEVEKPKGAELATGSVLQSDYQVKWNAHEAQVGEMA